MRPIDILREAGIDQADVRTLLGPIPDITWHRWLTDDPRAGKHARMLFRLICEMLTTQR